MPFVNRDHFGSTFAMRHMNIGLMLFKDPSELRQLKMETENKTCQRFTGVNRHFLLNKKYTFSQNIDGSRP